MTTVNNYRMHIYKFTMRINLKQPCHYTTIKVTRQDDGYINRQDCIHHFPIHCPSQYYKFYSLIILQDSEGVK